MKWTIISLWLALFALPCLVGCSDDTPTQAGTTTGNPVLWDTGHIRLQADDFYLEADGVTYLANVDHVEIGGDWDSANNTYGTIELEWTEHGNDMRLYVYFQATTEMWWCDEIRTYDGHKDDGTRWIYYYGEFFKSPVGSAFDGDVDLTNDDSDNGVEGKLYFTAMHLEAF